jgi:hypothetical protein
MKNKGKNPSVSSGKAGIDSLQTDSSNPTASGNKQGCCILL